MNTYQPKLETVADYILHLQKFDPTWRVVVSTSAGGGIAIEHRDLRGEPVVAVFGANGGQFGENPLTEAEYAKQSERFLSMMQDTDYHYTTVHGDHRMVDFSVSEDTCYGAKFDRRIVERMVSEGLISEDSVDIERVKRRDR